jgi:hypothetical protein
VVRSQGGAIVNTSDDGHSIADLVVWWLCLVAAPLVLVAIELFHPAGFTQTPGMWAYLSEPQPHQEAHRALAYAGPRWWFTLHMIQTPMVGLVAVGLWRMVSDIGSDDGAAVAVLAWLSRIATFVMLIYFTVLDAIGGIGLGRSILQAQALAASGALSQDQLAGVITLLDTMWVDRWVGGVGSYVSLTASWAAFFAALLTALTLFIGRRAPAVPLLLLVAFGWEVQLSHAALHGPTGFGLLAVASVWIWFRRGQPAPRFA